MAVQLTIQGTTFNYPEQGTDPAWGSEATGWATAVSAALNTLLGSGDILETAFTINNNVTTPANVNGLNFDTSTVRAANVDYSIYRTSTTNPSGNSEAGTLYIIQDDSAPVGEKWKMSQRANENAGVTFSILDSGQLQITSTDIGSMNYSGLLKFRAKALGK